MAEFQTSTEPPLRIQASDLDEASVSDAPDTSDDDGSQPERGKEAEAAGPKLHQAERQRKKKLRRDGEARNLCKMTATMMQIEEMEQK